MKFIEIENKEGSTQLLEISDLKVVSLYKNNEYPNAKTELFFENNDTLISNTSYLSICEQLADFGFLNR